VIQAMLAALHASGNAAAALTRFYRSAAAAAALAAE
jgi:hypothetical protein